MLSEGGVAPGFAGVLGWPLKSTLSPAIHNAAFSEAGLPWLYFAWPVPPAALALAVGGLRALQAVGANVTMPHKETVLGLIDEASTEARAVGAVNTITRDGGRLIGDNTDVGGFREFLAADAGYDAAGASAVVLGSGGAARAVVKALDDLGCHSVVITARRPQAGASVAGVARRVSTSVEPWSAAGALVPAADLVINATSVGVDGRDPIPGAALRSGQVVIDLNYGPAVTPLVERALAAGCSAWGGVGMLVHQAAGSFRNWSGRPAPLAIMREAAEDALAGR